MTRADQIFAMLICGAIGDAIGSEYENRRIESVADFGEKLTITDDTILTVATCKAILRLADTEDLPKVLSEEMLHAFRAGITGLGSSTLCALQGLAAGGHWALVGRVGEYAKGAGAAMRIAPLTTVLDVDSDEDRRVIRDCCFITHKSDEAYASCLAMLTFLGSGNLESVIDSRVKDNLVSNLENDVGTVTALVENLGTTGAAFSAVPLAILSSDLPFSLLDMWRDVCSAGGDTDTICHLMGQLVGYRNGTDALPEELVSRFSDRYPDIIEVFARFAAAVEQP